MAQMTSRQPVTAEARARSQYSCCRQSGRGTGLCPGTSVFPVSVTPYYHRHCVILETDIAVKQEESSFMSRLF